MEGAGPLELRIRPAVEGDLVAISEIERVSYPNPWHPKTFASLLRQNRARVLVAERGPDGILGYAVFWWVLDQAELANLAVRRDARGRGLGSALLDRVLAETRRRGVESVFLEVRASNHSARRLYVSRGFTQVSVRRGYYQNPTEDALVLVRALGSAPEPGSGVGKDEGSG
jgi:ribosomal-protein-alanine N-acetyltransferase